MKTEDRKFVKEEQKPNIVSRNLNIDKNDTLAKALEKAMQEKKEDSTRLSSKQFAEPKISLDTLKKDARLNDQVGQDKKNQREPTKENVNALKEALSKIQKPVELPKAEIKSASKDEVSEELLKKVLAGE